TTRSATSPVSSSSFRRRRAGSRTAHRWPTTLLTPAREPTRIAATRSRPSVAALLPGGERDDLGDSIVHGNQDGCRDQLVPGRLRPGAGRPLLAVRSSQSDRKSTRLNSSHLGISYAVFCLK